jgi:hypothetical protein
MGIGDFLKQFKNRYWISIGGGVFVTLSLAHHWMDFWSLTWQAQLLQVIAGVPLVGWLLAILFSRTWIHAQRIGARRWWSFLAPALVVVTFFTWRSYSPPVIWHTLEITPRTESSSPEVALLEIKIPPGKVVDLEKMENVKGWELQDGVFRSVGKSATAIRHSFLGPAGAPVNLIFFTSPGSSAVDIELDGRKTTLDLRQPVSDQLQFQLSTSYKQGIPATPILFLVLVSDFVALWVLVLFVWLVQEIPQIERIEKGRDGFLSHRAGLMILLCIAVALHTLNFVTMPLILASDGWSYLQGAVHWLDYGNLDGVPPGRGPGTTFLFAPALLIFGNNPAGVKLVLHLLAIACVPIAYLLGWQLEGRRGFAFGAGMIALLTPDLMFYSNAVYSDVLNVFFGLLFLVLLFSALHSMSLMRLLSLFLIASFLVLLRPDNFSLYPIALAFVLWKLFWIRNRDPVSGVPAPAIRPVILNLVFCTILGLLPILGWSWHNLNRHGFFGMSNYLDEVLYTGWIYYGEASKVAISDTDSPAVLAISDAYRTYGPNDDRIVIPTGYEVYPTLIQAGYTDGEAMDLLGQAARDSILKNPRLAFQVLMLKFSRSLIPEPIAMSTLPLPDEPASNGGNQIYFREEIAAWPEWIRVQRKLFDLVQDWYRYAYPELIWSSLFAMALAIYRKQVFLWYPMVVITLLRIFFPLILALGNWRYVISGVIFLLLFLLAWVWSLVHFLKMTSAKPEGVTG